MTSSPKSISRLLIRWRDGDETALDELTPLVYDELRRIAHRHMRGERPGHSLQTTDLVNEFFLKIPDLQGISWKDRGHFKAVAALAMRRILVDNARKHGAQKRPQIEPIDLDKMSPIPAHVRPAEFVELDEAIMELEKIDPRKAQIVVLKYYGGTTDQETAEMLGISPATVNREWRAAKLWLLKILTTDSEDSRPPDEDQ